MKEQLELEIKNTIKQYKRATSLSKKHFYYNSVYCLIDIYQDLTKKVYHFCPRIIDILYNNHFETNKHNILISELSTPLYKDMIQQFSSNGIEIIEDNLKLEEEYFYDKINYQNACEIIFSFFEHYDNKMLPFVKEILENNVVFCSTDLEKLGYSIYVPSLKKSYIALFTNKNKISIEMLITLIHEIGHTIYNKTLYNTQNSLNYHMFLEVLPYFFEQAFIEFCYKNNIHNLECLKAQKNNIISLYNYLTNLGIINQFIERVNPKTLSLELNLNDLSQIKDYEFNTDSLIFRNCEENYLYSYGIALGFYYSDLHKKDSEKTKEYIKQFILDIGIYENSYLLKNYGINYDEFISCKYLKPIIQENQKRLNKTTQN